MNASSVVIASRISALVRIDQSAIAADARQSLEQAITMAYTYKGHRCNTDPLRRALATIEGIKSAKARALVPVLAHFIAQADVCRAQAKGGETYDIPSLVGDSLAYFDAQWAAFQETQQNKLAEAAVKRDATKAAKQAEQARAEHAKEAAARAIAERAETLAEQVARLTAELEAVKAERDAAIADLATLRKATSRKATSRKAA